MPSKKASCTTRLAFVRSVASAMDQGYTDLVVKLKGHRVVISGMANGVLCHATTVSSHTQITTAEKQAARCEKWLRELHPVKRRPQLGGRVIFKVDTGCSISTTIVPKVNRDGVNNADAFIREVLHFGIMRHGVSGLVAQLLEMATDPKYAKYQESGLKQ